MQARDGNVYLPLTLWALSIAAVSGCYERPLVPVAPCTRSRVAESVDVIGVEDVDLLLVVDDSNSMAEEQAQLIAQLPRLVQVLATGDRGLDGTVDFRPARSLHIGIVSSDMGIGVATGVDAGSCAPGNGDDGVLFRADGRSCASGTTGSVFDFAVGGDAAAFASAVGCTANLGAAGCGFEQQLESMLKALSPSSPEAWTAPGYVSPAFLSGTGHGGSSDLNAGFIRPSSVLAVIMLTDENDCSAADSAIFGNDPRFTSAIPNFRCTAFADRLHSVERYVEGLIALRERPGLVVFAAITGVPVSAVENHLTYDEILALPEMEERPDPARPTQLVAACRGPLQDVGAFPARRIVEVARGLQRAGAGTSIQSICQETFEAAIDRIAERLADVLRGACLPHALNTDAEGRVACVVHEVLPAVEVADPARSRCSALARPEAYTRVGEETEMLHGALLHHEVCAVRRLSVSEIGAAPGWFYDEASRPGSDVGHVCGRDAGGGQRISFSGIAPATGAVLRLVCDQTIPPGAAGDIGIGTFCEPAEAVDRCNGAFAPDRVTPLACDHFARACALPCTSSSSCSAAGLGGHVCDLRTADEIYGPRLPAAVGPDAIHGFCVNPICDD